MARDLLQQVVQQDAGRDGSRARTGASRAGGGAARSRVAGYDQHDATVGTMGAGAGVLGVRATAVPARAALGRAGGGERGG